MPSTLKKTLLEILRTNKYVQVEFQTKNNRIRSMTCTRNWEHVGNCDGMDSDKLNGPDIIAVYDYMVKEWRAFRVDKVLSYKILEHSDYDKQKETT